MKSKCDEQILEAEKRVKLAQDQALQQIKVVRETESFKSNMKENRGNVRALSQSAIHEPYADLNRTAPDLIHRQAIYNTNPNLNQTFTHSVSALIDDCPPRQIKAGGLTKKLRFGGNMKSAVTPTSSMPVTPGQMSAKKQR